VAGASHIHFQDKTVVGGASLRRFSAKTMVGGAARVRFQFQTGVGGACHHGFDFKTYVGGGAHDDLSVETGVAGAARVLIVDSVALVLYAPGCGRQGRRPGIQANGWSTENVCSVNAIAGQALGRICADRAKNFSARVKTLAYPLQ